MPKPSPDRAGPCRDTPSRRRAGSLAAALAGAGQPDLGELDAAVGEQGFVFPGQIEPVRAQAERVGAGVVEGEPAEARGNLRIINGAQSGQERIALGDAPERAPGAVEAQGAKCWCVVTTLRS